MSRLGSLVALANVYLGELQFRHRGNQPTNWVTLCSALYSILRLMTSMTFLCSKAHIEPCGFTALRQLRHDVSDSCQLSTFALHDPLNAIALISTFCSLEASLTSPSLYALRILSVSLITSRLPSVKSNCSSACTCSARCEATVSYVTGAGDNVNAGILMTRRSVVLSEMPNFRKDSAIYRQ